MALKTVCDLCGADIVDADTQPLDFRGKRLHLSAERHMGLTWQPADICAACLHAAADAHDKSARPAEKPYGPFRWLVTLEGVRTPGPHAGFLFEDEARRFAHACVSDAEVKSV